GTITLGTAASIGGTGNSSTFSGAFTGAFDVTKVGTGTWTFSGNSSAWNNGITVSAGTLITTTVNSLGSATGTAAVSSGATLQITGALTMPASKPLQLAGTGVGGVGALTTTAAATWSGNILLTADATIGGAGATAVLSGIISDGGANFGLTKIGSGTYALQNANTYGGATFVNVGTLRVDNATGLGAAPGGAVTVASGATLSPYIASAATLTIVNKAVTLNGSGVNGIGAFYASTYANGAAVDWQGTVTLASDSTFGGNTQSGSTISGQITGPGALIKVGNNSLTLSGNNDYTGPTICAGPVIAAHANALGSTASTVTVIDGGSLTVSGVAIGAKPMILCGLANGLGATLVASGTCSYAGSITLIERIGFGGSGTMTLSGVISGRQGILKSGAGAFILTNTNAISGGIEIQTGEIQATSEANLGTSDQVITLNGGTLNAMGTFSSAQRITLTSTGTIAVSFGCTFTLSGTVSGSGSLTKTAQGTLVFTGNNSYTGTTTITTGTLQGSTSSIPGDIIDNATLIFDQANDGRYTGTITGSGTLTKSGNGILTLATSNAYTGATTVSAGVLDVAHFQGLGTTAGTTTVS
ncbi:MAG: autotransporter-associated beta strand repeat-containing protein, partial [Planctomycetota bacterium]